LSLAGPGDDVHRARHRTLNASDLLGVEAELNDVSRPSVSSELGVERLIGAIRQANDEVREPTPLHIDEGCLVHNRRPVAHRWVSVASRDAPADVPGLSDANDAEPERRQVSSLVLFAFPPNEVSMCVVPVRLFDVSARNSNLKCREMLASRKGG